MSSWNPAQIDSLASQKTFVITGGTSGIGLATARELLARDAIVIIAADDEKKGHLALRSLKAEFPKAQVEFKKLDLGSFPSIDQFVSEVLRDYTGIDVLINNAGLAATQRRMESASGHELIFAVNYLGHFALTAKLFPVLMRGRDPRVICSSSLGHKYGLLNFEDFDLHKDYSSQKAYAQSKLAMLMFSLEMARRCEANGIHLRSIPVHPGAVDTNIFSRGPQLAGNFNHPVPFIERVLCKLLAQRSDQGAYSTLFAATSLEARSGIYYGPDSFMEIRGNPTEAKVSAHAESRDDADRLWKVSEKLTGVKFDVNNSKTISLH